MIVLYHNVAFHKAKSLKIPENIYLVFLPPYSPKLNPAEKMWAILKKTSQTNSLKPLNALETLLQIALKHSRLNKLLKHAIINTLFALKFGLYNNFNWYNLCVRKLKQVFN